MKVGDLVRYDPIFNDVNDWRIYVNREQKSAPGLIIKKRFEGPHLRSVYEVRWKNGTISLESEETLLIFRRSTFSEKDVQE